MSNDYEAGPVGPLEFLARSGRRHSMPVVTPGQLERMQQTLNRVQENGPHHRQPMELYLVRINPPCRTVWLYMLQHQIPHILVDIDFTKHKKLPDKIKKLPHQEVPILMDGDIIVYECPAILTYLATQYTDYADYGFSTQERMMCESILSWANSELHRCVGFNYIYPQFLEKYALPDDSANEALMETGLKQLSHHLEMLEKKYLKKSKFLTGDRLCIGDTYVATILVQLEWTRMRLKMWPKVESWLQRVKQQEYWDTVHVSHDTFLKELETSSLFH